MNQRAFSREEKLHILHQLLSGEKYLSQLSREFGVSHTAISQWRHQYEEKGEAAFVTPDAEAESPALLQARIKELERFCGQLSLENSVLKKALRLLPPNNAMR